MDYFNPLTEKKAQKLVQKRKGEAKFFENISFRNPKQTIEEQLNKSKTEFVLFGISEDIGVRANFGKSGTKKAWNVVLNSLLNIQSNRFTNPAKLLILGHFNFDKIDQKSKEMSTQGFKLLAVTPSLMSEGALIKVMLTFVKESP